MKRSEVVDILLRAYCNVEGKHADVAVLQKTRKIIKFFKNEEEKQSMKEPGSRIFVGGGECRKEDCGFCIARHCNTDPEFTIESGSKVDCLSYHVGKL